MNKLRITNFEKFNIEIFTGHPPNVHRGNFEVSKFLILYEKLEVCSLEVNTSLSTMRRGQK